MECKSGREWEVGLIDKENGIGKLEAPEVANLTMYTVKSCLPSNHNSILGAKSDE